jgi:hypothetical protein
MSTYAGVGRECGDLVVKERERMGSMSTPDLDIRTLREPERTPAVLRAYDALEAGGSGRAPASRRTTGPARTA